MRFSRGQLKLSSILFYSFGLATICLELILHPASMSWLGRSLGTGTLFFIASFVVRYFNTRRNEDRVLDYSVGSFLFFVLCRPVIPFAFTAWAIYAVSQGSDYGLRSALSGLGIFLGHDLAEFVRIVQNGFQSDLPGDSPA